MTYIIKKTHIFLFFVLLFSSYNLNAESHQFENQIVEDIEINLEASSATKNQLEKRTIATKMKTRVGDVFSQTYFDGDLKLLSIDYDRIEPEVTSKDGKMFIKLNIWPNPIIRSICWDGNKKIKSSRLKTELGVDVGSVFDCQKFIQSFNKIKAYYIKKGFFEAELQYQLVLDDECNEVDVIVNINEGRAGKIEKISFCNFTKKEQNELLDLIVTKQYNLFLSWFTGEGTYNEDMIQYDQFNVLNYLQNKGYADATVEIEVTESKTSNRIIVCIKADRGRCYNYGSITFEGNELFNDDNLRKCILVCQNDRFSPEKIMESVKKITDLYGSLGYIEASVNYDAKLIEGENRYSINIVIDEGDQYFVGLIKVLGNCSTETNVILHESLLIPGEVFNLKKLQLTERRLCNIGYFKTVNVYAVKSEEGSILPSNYRDIHIEVEETNTGHMGAFMGFSSTENMFGGVNLTEKNFNYKGLTCFWKDGMRSLRGAGEYAHITLQLGAKSTSYALSWTKPYFMDTPWSVGFDLDRSKNEYISDKYEITSYGLTVHGTYDYNAFLRVGTHYRIKHTDFDVSSKCGKDLKEEAKNSGLLSAIGLSLNYDSTNHPMKPTCGVKSRLEAEVAGFGGDRQFFSTGYLNSYFYDLWGAAIFKLRADFRFIQPLGKTSENDMPIEEKFFLGGDNCIRGYRPYRLGPKYHKKAKPPVPVTPIVLTEEDTDPGTDVSAAKKPEEEKEAPEGGLSMQLFSAELIRPIFSRFDAFLFFDAGSVSENKFDFGKFYCSTGFGCRVQVFENGPPLTIGMGFPLSPVDSNDVKRFFITVGGKF